MNKDAAVLRCWADEKSDAAFTELVRRHLDLVYSAPLRRVGGDAHAAADIAQQVFTKLARDARKLSDHVVLTAWLYTATRHAAIDRIRSEHRRAAREQEATAMQNLAAAAPEADWEKLRPVLDEVMDELPDADRTAVLLRFFEKRPFADIGAALRVSEDAARMRVERALEKLRVLLAHRGVKSTAAALAVALSEQAVVGAPAGLAASITGAAIVGGGSAAAGTGFLMSTTTTFVTGAIAVAVVGFSVVQFNRAQRAEAQLAAIVRDSGRLRSELRDMQQRVARANEENVSLQRELAATQTARVAAESAAKPVSASTGQLVGVRNPDGTVTFRRSPVPLDPAEQRRRAREFNLEGMDIAYGAFYRKAAFTPAQVEQFKALMTAINDRREVLMMAAMSEGKAQNQRFEGAVMQSAVKAISQQTSDECLTAMRSTFGEATAQAWHHYVDTLAAREVTKVLANAPSYNAAPLTDAQTDQLVEVLAANSRNAAGKVDLAVMKAEAIFAETQAFLSPPQLAALRWAQAEVLRRAGQSSGASR